MFYLALSFPDIKERCPPVSKREHGLNQPPARFMTTSHQEGTTPHLDDVAANVSTIGKWKLKVVRGEW